MTHTVTDIIRQQIEIHEHIGPFKYHRVRLDQQNNTRLKLLCDHLGLSKTQVVALLLPPAIEEALAAIGITYQ